MSFEIHELGNVPGIIHIHREDGRLTWDFPLGSPYELCAVFDAMEGQTLRELQLAGASPFLFHKRLRTSCAFDSDRCRNGFLLFPARFTDGVLDIGNQQTGQDALIPLCHSTLQIEVQYYWKILFLRFQSASRPSKCGRRTFSPGIPKGKRLSITA